MNVSINEAAQELGVSQHTLRRWEAEGKIEVEHTPGGHRRYDLASLRRIIPGLARPDRLTIGYARVSTPASKDELTEQVALIKAFCLKNDWSYEIIEDIGSGLNYDKRGLRLLLHKMAQGNVGRLVLVNKDRLLRLGAELIFALCKELGIEVVLMNTEVTPAFEAEEELTADILELVTIFSVRLYAGQSDKNRVLLAKLKEVLDTSASEGP